MTARAFVPTEAQVQERVKAVYRAVGCVVASFSQGWRPGGKRHATTRQTKGIPDLYVFPPVRYREPFDGCRVPVTPLAPFWHETKRPGGKQSPEQLAWQRECEARGVGYVLGGVDEALAYLRLIGLVR